jgi:hypothetical protein
MGEESFGQGFGRNSFWFLAFQIFLLNNIEFL